MPRPFTFVTDGECSGTVTVLVGPIAVWTFGGVVHGRLSAPGGGGRRRLLRRWVPLIVPCSTPPASSSSGVLDLRGAIEPLRHIDIFP